MPESPEHPLTTATTERRQWLKVIRVSTASVLVVGWLLGASWLAVFLGLASTSYGWLTTGLLLAGGTAAIIALYRFHARWFLVATLVLGLTLGTAVWHEAPPEPARLVRLADQTQMPTGWHTVDESVRGNTWCFKGCPVVTRTYQVTADPGQARDAFIASLTAQGWSVREQPAGSSASATLGKGRWRVWMQVKSPRSPDLPPGAHDVQVRWEG